MSPSSDRPGLLLSVLMNRCPRCRRGKLFTERNPYRLRTTVRMPLHCPACGHRFEDQPGFFYGTGYVSYALAVGFSMVSFLVWYLVTGIAFADSRVFWWLLGNSIVLVALQPVLQRLSRSIWIAFFVRYDRDWKRAGASKSAS